MKKLFYYLIDIYLGKYHDYKISMSLSKEKTMLTIFYRPFFLSINRYSKERIDDKVRERLCRYYMDDISHITKVYYVNKITYHIDRYDSVF